MSALPNKTKLDLHWSRRLFHTLTGTLVSVFLLSGDHKKSDLKIYVIFAALLALFDLLRLVIPFVNFWVLKVFGRLMRHDETHKPSAQFFYILGLCLAFFFLPQPLAIQTILIMAWMDPAAGIIGRRWGRTPWNSILNRVFSDARPVGLNLGVKTVEGSAAGFLMAFIVSYLSWWILSPPAVENSKMIYFYFSLTGAAVATVAEAWPTQWDDNVTVPFWTGISLLVLAWLWGLSL